MWVFLESLVVIAIVLLVVWKVIIPMLAKKDGVPRTAINALERAKWHIEEATRLISLAETNAETGAAEAQAALLEAKRTMAAVKLTAKKIKPRA